MKECTKCEDKSHQGDLISLSGTQDGTWIHTGCFCESWPDPIQCLGDHSIIYMKRKDLLKLIDYLCDHNIAF